jgi:hypothetical protein
MDRHCPPQPKYLHTDVVPLLGNDARRIGVGILTGAPIDLAFLLFLLLLRRSSLVFFDDGKETMRAMTNKLVGPNLSPLAAFAQISKNALLRVKSYSSSC